MKKIVISMLVVLILVCFTLGVFVGCETTPKGRINIVCTIFPIYDWVRNIVGDADNVQVTLLMDSGVDLHSFDPTAQDIVTVGASDMFVYVGGESDTWVDRVLAQKTNENLVAINLMEVLADFVREEEEVEGMTPEDESSDENEHEHVFDEHVWLSLKNAQVAVSKITAELAQIDSDYAATYNANAADYNQKLSALDQQFRQVVDSAVNKTLVFADRFPFLYLTYDYGITYFAAFAGCAAAEAGASPETIAFLAGKLDELGLKYVLETEGSSNGLSQTVINATASKNQIVLKLDSMQSVTAAKVQQGATYLGIMQSNLAVLETALN